VQDRDVLPREARVTRGYSENKTNLRRGIVAGVMGCEQEEERGRGRWGGRGGGGGGGAAPLFGSSSISFVL